VSAFALLAASSGADFGTVAAPLVAQQHAARFIEDADAQPSPGKSLSDTLTRDDLLHGPHNAPKNSSAGLGDYTSPYDAVVEFSDSRGADFEYVTSALSEVNEVNAPLISSDTKGITVVPEPSSMVLMGAGLAALSVFRRRFRRA
jgi:hypothetical protein